MSSIVACAIAATDFSDDEVEINSEFARLLIEVKDNGYDNRTEPQECDSAFPTLF